MRYILKDYDATSGGCPSSYDDLKYSNQNDYEHNIWLTASTKPIEEPKKYGANQPFYDVFGPSITEGKSPVAMTLPSFIATVQNCQLTCYRMFSLLTGKYRERQSKLLHDCAQICSTQVILTTMDSVFSKEYAIFCARVCQVCVNECHKYTDKASKHCGDICLETVKACKGYSQSL